MKDMGEEVVIRNVQDASGLYFPLASEKGLQGALTPDLHGDLKTDQNHFLIEPASAEDLSEKNTMRNFFLSVSGEGEEDLLFSLTGNSPFDKVRRGTKEELSADAKLLYGCMEVTRSYPYAPVSSKILSFIPYDTNEEIHRIAITNESAGPIRIRLTASIPIFGRSADNLRDHRHVTSLLNRARVEEKGIFLTPSMSFDERGHKENSMTTYVVGTGADGTSPDTFYPDLDAFVGAGNLIWPDGLVCPEKEAEKFRYEAGETVDGREILGAFSFPEKTLSAGECAVYLVKIGIADDPKAAEEQAMCLLSDEEVLQSLEKSHSYWASKSPFGQETGDASFDTFMKWVAFQPTLRRVFGCSFLPHHDYGRGGRGWRDLWQDCLALLLADPASMRADLISQFGGVRTDGTNATIIGDKPGEFKSDRNNIPRLWCDHAAWPLQTVLLYIEESGDFGILSEETPYFRDAFTHRVSRTLSKEESGFQKASSGTVFEHILLEQLTSVYDVGVHGNIRLHNADWNDAMDMAAEGGESVPFTAFYAGNLKDLARLLRDSCLEAVSIAEEMEGLLSPMHENNGKPLTIQQKRGLLESYCDTAAGGFSGRKKEIPARELSDFLDRLSEEIADHINTNEFLQEGNLAYYRGYYDNDKQPLEEITRKDISLIAQVYPLMYGIADGEKTDAVLRSTKELLFRPGRGGYALNSDYRDHIPHMKMGRMFGFAYGTKENGAVFSHMAVMFANALFRRDRREAGFEALKELYRASMNFPASRIFPGIPEYFDLTGQGYYHYLTGAASWYLYTMVTEVYGLRGHYGDLCISPALLPELFDEGGKTSVTFAFRGLPVTIVYEKGKPSIGKDRLALQEVKSGQDTFEARGNEGIIIPFEKLKNEAGGGAVELTARLS